MAQDLHDDLGAGLTEVNMLGSLVRSATTTADEKSRYLDQLAQVARRLVTSLDEIVWAVNPRKDSVASLASYFASYAQQFLELASVSCGLDIAENLPRCPLNSKFRHSLFLAFKEALNNIARHAGASEARLQIKVEGDQLVLALTDNGRGLDASEPGPGADGLLNMRQRISALGGQCDVNSLGQTGTMVLFRVPVPQA
jgi:signal transduction histidine kinase